MASAEAALVDRILRLVPAGIRSKRQTSAKSPGFKRQVRSTSCRHVHRDWVFGHPKPARAVGNRDGRVDQTGYGPRAKQTPLGEPFCRAQLGSAWDCGSASCSWVKGCRPLIVAATTPTRDNTDAKPEAASARIPRPHYHPEAASNEVDPIHWTGNGLS